LIFKNPRWQTDAILKTVNRHFSAMVRPIVRKFGMVMHIACCTMNFENVFAGKYSIIYTTFTDLPNKTAKIIFKK